MPEKIEHVSCICMKMMFLLEMASFRFLKFLNHEKLIVVGCHDLPMGTKLFSENLGLIIEVSSLWEMSTLKF